MELTSILRSLRTAIWRAMGNDVLDIAKASAYSGMLMLFPAFLVLTTLLAVVPAGNGLLTTTQTPTPTIGNVLAQGAIEDSNVKSITEITDLIQIQRAYEQATNLIGQQNTSLSDAIDKLSQTTS